METTKSNTKKRSPAIFFVAAFAIIIIVMFLANQQTSTIAEFNISQNKGMARLSTSGNHLVAVFQDNQTYVWDWNDLSKEPQTILAQSEQTVLLKSNILVSLHKAETGTIKSINLEDGKELKKVYIGSKSKDAFLKTNRNRSRIALLLTAIQPGNTTGSKHQLSAFDPDLRRVGWPIEIVSESANDKLADLALSDDGKVAAIVGEKNNKGWLIFIGIDQKKILWQKELPETTGLTSVALPPDGKTIYAGTKDGRIYKIKAESGALLGLFGASGQDKDKEIVHVIQMSLIKKLTISPDGQLLAADTNVFDRKSEKKLFSARGGKVPGPIAFSPDSKLVATSDIRASGAVRIRHIPID